MTITVTGPNGVSVQFPEGTDANTITSVMAKHFGGGEPSRAAPQITKTESALRGLGQGLSFNWLDEILGYGKNLPSLAMEGIGAATKAISGMESGKRSDGVASPQAASAWSKAQKDVAAERELNRQAKEANPMTFFGGELAGGLGSGLAAMMLPGGQMATAARMSPTALAAASNVKSVPTLMGRVGQGAKVGAGYGAVAGAGAAESAPDASLADAATNTAIEAGKGAGMGMAIGAAMPPVFDAAGALISPITNFARAKINPQGMAADKLSEAFQRDAGGSRGDVYYKSKTTPGLYSDAESMIADAGGENVQRKMRSALNVPNDQRTQFMEGLDARAGKQPAKIEREMVGALGDPKKYYEAADAIIQSKSAQAGPAYKAAFDAPFDWHATKFEDVLNRPTMQVIRDRVVKRMLDSGAPGDTGEAVVNSMRPMEFLHHMKVELDHLIGQASKAERRGDATSKDSFDLRTLMRLKEDFFDALKSSGGEGPQLYMKAMKQYADHASLTRALELGYEHAGSKEAPEVVARALNGMSPPEQELYRLGVARNWAEKNREGSKLNDRIKRDWSSPQREMMLDVVAKTPEDRRAFQQALDAMMEHTKTRQKAQGNSTTAAQLLEAQNDTKPAEMLKLGKNVVMGQWGSLMDKLAQKAAPLGGMTPEVASEMLKILASPLNAPKPGAAAGTNPFSWRYQNAVSGLPALESALNRRAARELGILRATGAGTGAGVGILTNQ